MISWLISGVVPDVVLVVSSFISNVTPVVVGPGFILNMVPDPVEVELVVSWLIFEVYSDDVVLVVVFWLIFEVIPNVAVVVVSEPSSGVAESIVIVGSRLISNVVAGVVVVIYELASDVVGVFCEFILTDGGLLVSTVRVRTPSMKKEIGKGI